MRATFESTDKIVALVINGIDVPARVWEGVTENGVKCHAFITRVAVANLLDSSEFDRDLKAHRAPTAEVAAIPLRFII